MTDTCTDQAHRKNPDGPGCVCGLYSGADFVSAGPAERMVVRRVTEWDVPPAVADLARSDPDRSAAALEQFVRQADPDRDEFSAETRAGDLVRVEFTPEEIVLLAYGAAAAAQSSAAAFDMTPDVAVKARIGREIDAWLGIAQRVAEAGGEVDAVQALLEGQPPALLAASGGRVEVVGVGGRHAAERADEIAERQHLVDGRVAAMEEMDPTYCPVGDLYDCPYCDPERVTDRLGRVKGLEEPAHVRLEAARTHRRLRERRGWPPHPDWSPIEEPS